MIEYTSPIDPHVHLRWEEYKDFNFLGLGFRDAKAVGLSAVLEQPNTRPQLVDIHKIEKRIRQVKSYSREIKHGIHIGITTDYEQVKTALASIIARTHHLISDKTFYVHSTGNMGILDEDYQKRIWKLKGEVFYNRVSIGHFEDELEFRREFDYKNPITHSQRQTPESELIQVQRQLKNAVDNRFKGIFYIAHVSNPSTIDLIEDERRKIPFEVVLEATFHHMFLNIEDYNAHGNLVKMNPPLREPRMQEELLERVINGKVQIIGTDHAPHPLETKKSSAPPSGIPVLPFWPKGIELLRNYGMREAQIENMTFDNPNRIFKLNLQKRKVEADYNPSLWESYGFNPFKRVDGTG